MDPVEQLDHLIPMLDAIVDGIGADQLDEPTACSNFTVAGVLEHMIGGASAFAPAFRGESPEGAIAPGGGTPQARFHRAMADLLDAVHTPGAQERTIAAPFGEVSGETFTRYVAFDGLVHGWDLTSATEQPYAPADALVDEVDAFARQFIGPQFRDGDTFAAETEPPAGSSTLERLVAFSGREVN